MGDRVRTHFVIDRDLLAEFDRLVPARKRSETVNEIVREWVRRERAKEILNWAGFVKAEDHPEWATREDVSRWVRELRGEWRDPWDEEASRESQVG
jgi:metal-responsive CopG/Arc/MetJ family transcriptional regulator